MRTSPLAAALATLALLGTAACERQDRVDIEAEVADEPPTAAPGYGEPADPLPPDTLRDDTLPDTLPIDRPQPPDGR